MPVNSICQQHHHHLFCDTKVLCFRKAGLIGKLLITLSQGYQCVPTSWEVKCSLLRGPHNGESGAITSGAEVTACMDVNASLVWGVWLRVQFTTGRWHQPIITVTVLTVRSRSCTIITLYPLSQTITRSCPARRHILLEKTRDLRLK